MRDSREDKNTGANGAGQGLEGAALTAIDPVVAAVVDQLKSNDPAEVEAGLAAIYRGKIRSSTLIEPLINILAIDYSERPEAERDKLEFNSYSACDLLSAYGTEAANALAHAMPGKSAYQRSVMAGEIDTLLTYADAQINFTSTVILGDIFSTSFSSRDEMERQALFSIGEIFETLQKNPEKVIQDCPLDGSATESAYLRLDEWLARVGNNLK